MKQFYCGTLSTDIINLPWRLIGKQSRYFALSRCGWLSRALMVQMSLSFDAEHVVWISGRIKESAMWRMSVETADIAIYCPDISQLGTVDGKGMWKWKTDALQLNFISSFLEPQGRDCDSLVWQKLIRRSQGSAFWVCCKLHTHLGLKCQTSHSNQVAFDAVLIGIGISPYYSLANVRTEGLGQDISGLLWALFQEVSGIATCNSVLRNHIGKHMIPFPKLRGHDKTMRFETTRNRATLDLHDHTTIFPGKLSQNCGTTSRGRFQLPLHRFPLNLG